jgi:hypothetical protein
MIPEKAGRLPEAGIRALRAIRSFAHFLGEMPMIVAVPPCHYNGTVAGLYASSIAVNGSVPDLIERRGGEHAAVTPAITDYARCRMLLVTDEQADDQRYQADLVEKQGDHE